MKINTLNSLLHKPQHATVNKYAKICISWDADPELTGTSDFWEFCVK